MTKFPHYKISYSYKQEQVFLLSNTSVILRLKWWGGKRTINEKKKKKKVNVIDFRGPCKSGSGTYLAKLHKPGYVCLYSLAYLLSLLHIEHSPKSVAGGFFSSCAYTLLSKSYNWWNLNVQIKVIQTCFHTIRLLLNSQINLKRYVSFSLRKVLFFSFSTCLSSFHCRPFSIFLLLHGLKAALRSSEIKEYRW